MAKASTMPLVRIGSDVSLSIRPHNVVTFRDGGQPSAKIGREEEERAGEEMAKRGGKRGTERAGGKGGKEIRRVGHRRELEADYHISVVDLAFV